MSVLDKTEGLATEQGRRDLHTRWGGCNLFQGPSHPLDLEFLAVGQSMRRSTTPPCQDEYGRASDVTGCIGGHGKGWLAVDLTSSITNRKRWAEDRARECESENSNRRWPILI